MTLVLGRVGTDIALNDPEDWSRAGDTVTLVGRLHGSGSVADGVTLSEQLLGLVNNRDEPAIACTWSQEAWFDGYYVVESVDVGSTPIILANGWAPYQVRLRRLANHSSPRIDNILIGGVRTNGNSVTTGDPMTWAPAYPGATSTTIRSPIFDIGVTRVSDTGTLYVADFGPSESAACTGWAAFDIAPASYYNGGCLIRAGTTLRRVIGDRTKMLPTNWEIGNGLVRFTPTTDSQVVMEVFDGSSWEGSKTLMFTTTGNTNKYSGAWGHISILRNSPEVASIRLNASHSSFGAGTVDITVRRGDRFATIYSAANGLGIGCSTAEAATALTGGIRATSNDAAGNRYVLACAQAVTNNVTQGSVRPTSGTGASALMAGVELGGSGASSIQTAQSLINQWYYAMSERMTPRIR